MNMCWTILYEQFLKLEKKCIVAIEMYSQIGSAIVDLSLKFFIDMCFQMNKALRLHIALLFICF